MMTLEASLEEISLRMVRRIQEGNDSGSVEGFQAESVHVQRTAESKYESCY